MIHVSQDYMEKSLAPGREVKCRIIAGENVYTDTDILSFELNDVVHPEDMSLGTTCANRFQFELWSRRNIPLSAVIRPFVWFVGDDGVRTEDCSLGEFYITRRYRKRERYSVTCYDKMYRLDARYRPRVKFPCTAPELLSDIAEQYGFAVGFVPEEDVINSVPQMTTCREVIGYIAGLGGGFAKFDRSGILQLKKLDLCSFRLNRDQYTEMSFKADKLEVRQIEFISGDEVFSAGRGTKLTTYRQYNPLATQEATDRVFEKWNGFSYYGMTVKMRGMPFLESGDSIEVQDDFDNMHYRAIISDYTLEYNGGLRARLISKSKNPIDDYEEPMTQQKLMESLSENLRMRYFNYVNEEDISIGVAATSIASINFNLDTTSFIVFNSQFTVTASVDCIITLNYQINNVTIGQTPRVSLYANKPMSVCLYNCFEDLRPGRSTLTVTASVNTDSAVIEAGELIASVSGQYMLGDNGPQRPEINIWQGIENVSFDMDAFTLKRLTETFCEEEITSPTGDAVSENLPFISFAPVRFTLRGLNANLCIEAKLRDVQRIADNKLALAFTNAVSFTGAGIDLAGFAVTFGLDELIIDSAEISSNDIILTTEDLSGFDEIVIKYDSASGNMLSETTGNPLQSFNFILAL